MPVLTVAGRSSGDDEQNVGAVLRHARRQRALSLAELADATKIRVTLLRAIEANQRGQLPETIFLRGFVRAYAREVGLDPDDVARRYLEQFEPVTQPAASATDDEQPRQRDEGATRPGANSHPEWSGASAWQWIVVGILVVGVLTYGMRRQSDHATTAAQPIAIQPHARPEIGTSGSRAAGATAIRPAVLRLEIRTVGPCWVSAEVDGTRAIYALMQAGERRIIELHREATLRIGDPRVFEFSIDGTRGRSVGRSGEPVTIHVTADNYRDFLPR